MSDRAYQVGVLDSDARAREKQASRDRDAARLASGEIDRDSLRRKNGFFSSLEIKNFKIVSVGGRSLADAR